MQTPQAALDAIGERGKRPWAIHADARLTLTDPAGQSVRVDATYFITNDGRARVRAWKLGQAVFDITVTPQGVWLFTGREEARPSLPGVTRAVRQWVSYFGGSYADGQAAPPAGDERFFTISSNASAGESDATLRVTIDRLWAAPVRFELIAAPQPPRFAMTMGLYAFVPMDEDLCDGSAGVATGPSARASAPASTRVPARAAAAPSGGAWADPPGGASVGGGDGVGETGPSAGPSRAFVKPSAGGSVGEHAGASSMAGID